MVRLCSWRFAALGSLALAVFGCGDDDVDPSSSSTTTASSSGVGGASTTSSTSGGQGGLGGQSATGGAGGAGGSGGAGGAGGGELTTNGDFEAGNLDGWTTFINDGSLEATMEQANGGLWSGHLVASVPNQTDPPSSPLIKQANLGIGVVQPNSTVQVSFDVFGSLGGAGGVVVAEFFSELDGGGTSKAEILSGGPLFPVAPNDWTMGWVSYQFMVTTGPDVSAGVTLQLKADCGPVAGCLVDIYVDNASVVLP